MKEFPLRRRECAQRKSLAAPSPTQPCPVGPFAQQLIFAYVGADMLANLSGCQQQPHTEAIHANVVADRRKVLYAFAYQSTNEVLRNSAQPKPTHHHGGAIENVLNCLVRATDDLIHRKRNSKGNSSRKQ